MQPASFETVLDKVRLAVRQARHVGTHDISTATNLSEDLHFGRFTRLKLAMYLEEIFDIDIADEIVGHLETVGDVALYVSAGLPSPINPLGLD